MKTRIKNALHRWKIY